MPKELSFKNKTHSTRKLTNISLNIDALSRDVRGTFRFSIVDSFEDGTKEVRTGPMVTATEANLAPFLTDAMWDAVSALAHGLADKRAA